jgi:methylmalonyl-CoA carboxyltransferase 1.3S subunit
VKLNVTIDGRTYEVDVEAIEPDVRAPQPGAVGTAPVAAGVAPAPAPVPAPGGAVDDAKAARSRVAGIVVRVDVSVGQSVDIGDVLVVLEAMKMETNITASVAGTISAIHISHGDSVQPGQIVVEVG